jgi:hypothetical protein
MYDLPQIHIKLDDLGVMFFDIASCSIFVAFIALLCLAVNKCLS